MSGPNVPSCSSPSNDPHSESPLPLISALEFLAILELCTSSWLLSPSSIGSGIRSTITVEVLKCEGGLSPDLRAGPLSGSLGGLWIDTELVVVDTFEFMAMPVVVSSLSVDAEPDAKGDALRLLR
jgi:hypothetical protein